MPSNNYFPYNSRFGDQRFPYENNRVPFQNGRYANDPYNRFQPFRPFNPQQGDFAPQFGPMLGANLGLGGGYNNSRTEREALRLQDRQDKRANTGKLITTGIAALAGLILAPKLFDFLKATAGGLTAGSRSAGNQNTAVSEADKKSAQALLDESKKLKDKAIKVAEGDVVEAKKMCEEAEKKAQEANYILIYNK